MEKLTSNVIAVSYKDSNQIAFTITTLEKTSIGSNEVFNICYQFFTNLFPNDKIEIKSKNPIGGYYTEFEVSTPFGLKTLTWSWVSNIDYTESQQLEKPLQWLRNKLGIVKGSSYSEPKITLTQVASWISEYVATFCKK